MLTPGVPFDRVAFEAGIRLAMNLGLPAAEEDRPLFRFPRVRAYPPGTVLDHEGHPLDPNVAPTITTQTPVRIPCAIEWDDASPDQLPPGVRVPTRLTITMLDDEYQQVKDAVIVEVGGDRYQISHVAPPVALSDSGVWTLIAYAEAET